VSFGRRLDLFFLLIVLVPTLALIAVVLVVSEDSRKGKADARLAAGLDTATGLYSERVDAARPDARALARDPELAQAIVSSDAAARQAFADAAVTSRGLAAIALLDSAGAELASAGSPDAIAFAEITLAQGGETSGTLRVSRTLAPDYVGEVRDLTGRELVVSRDGEVVGESVPPPATALEPGETTDVESDGREFRGHLETLDPEDAETLLLLGPRKEGSFLAIGRSAALILAGFLLLAGIFAWTLTRTLARLHTQVEEQAATDPLTGLNNRRRLWELIDREIERSRRFGHPLSLLIFDVDDFKAINDLHGHLKGDEVLASIAKITRAEARSIDIVGRYGGDELALVLVETGSEGAAIFAERLCMTVRATELSLANGDRLAVTISVGVATALPGSLTVDSLVDTADRALLEAKRAGKNQIRSARAYQASTRA
jgi:diguanylate cyclase (GGDEF)-like protein